MEWGIFLHALTSYIVIIDPLGAALIFNSLTGDGNRRYIFYMALKSVLISSSILLLFGFFGEAILTKLGISIGALRISGGLLLFYTAFNMITGGGGDALKPKGTDISVFPMSIPLTAGPGCITLTILLFSQAEASSDFIPLVFAIISIFSLTFIAYISSKWIKVVIGKTGDDILKRLFGVILAALAIQFVVDGIKMWGAQ